MVGVVYPTDALYQIGRGVAIAQGPADNRLVLSPDLRVLEVPT
jgi:hypothetical protein